MSAPVIAPARLEAEFLSRHGEPPHHVVRAPGRVNLIGEHTDYNDGFVLPMAIERAAWVALRPRADRIIEVAALNFGDAVRVDLDRLAQPGSGWGRYLEGMAWVLERAGHRLRGFDGVLWGDVPIGAGLSSSAALELAFARALALSSGLDWDGTVMARLGQRAENEWVGVQCGIMDQLISALGRAGHALLIDCRSLATQLVPVPADTRVVILDTGVRRQLVDSAYNARRRECSEAAQALGVASLRDVSWDEFCRRERELPELPRRRARHVIGENRRTLHAAEVLAAGDAAAMGQLMGQSHASLRDDYEVSCRELDIMVECAAAHPACFGARMTGAGFGGCAVALVAARGEEEFVARVAAAYQERAGRRAEIYVSQAAEGASVVSSSPGGATS